MADDVITRALERRTVEGAALRTAIDAFSLKGDEKGKAILVANRDGVTLGVVVLVGSRVQLKGGLEWAAKDGRAKEVTASVVASW
ncbi:MAG: hypothetical protein IT348_05960 [Candidatus Eisenbacteria bacterium]|nr:hypothetical protein [Candidatus Eisenbacteria bacterium]